MIEKMKHYTFLVYHGKYDDFLEKLRDVGVLHVTQRDITDEQSQDLQDRLLLQEKIGKVLAHLETLLPEGAAAVNTSEKPSAELLDKYDELIAEKTRLEQQMEAVRAEADKMTPWGNYSVEHLEMLKQAGHEVHAIVCQADKYDDTIANAVLISRDKINAYYVIIGDMPEQYPGDVVQLCARNHGQLLTDIDNIHGLQVANTAKLQQFAIANIEALKTLREDVRHQTDWRRVHYDTQAVAQDTVMLLDGYCPQDSEQLLIDMLEEQGVYYVAQDPKRDEPIPIKLKNNFFSRLFEPITNLYSLPNYSEIDPTALFAPFFMLFFGLCMGDAGYGLLILAAGLYAVKKMPDYKSIGWLGVFLGISTIFAGCLTGVVFGINLDTVSWPWLKNVKHLFLTSNNYQAQLGYDPMMLLAIALGVIQILFAMCIKVSKITIQHGFKYAVSEAAWVILLVTGIVLLTLHYLVGMAWATPVMYALYGIAGLCASAILFYNNPDTNVFLNVGSGLWGTYNMISGLLGDVLSYIRLFALGLAGGILGNVFNQLAMQIGGSAPVWIGWLLMLLILLLGHGLNFMLCIISAIVHPMRLTFVEFYKNAGFEGGGLAYKPFKN